ncbi:MAG: YbhB/YbcL family Raf kinase inhibitor-like protein [Mojavia pulchra JT2-VF2]|jgi:Raf kinase inhibitor-like YbhB/YbcL family protein|uniref:YbhB/YbcL family Raf kinase inhibitor-like protein n=1 Tax=Mojavia pulchra JT2-VF2 TaxID=287848 RepID=A0A951PXM7_9NOST|nr:YbhB/YbcL family Raf kinase inhibitor-like protein [Mojavia pulchra JT2-VF2]
MEIRSSAFFIGNTIPFKYTCDGENISPPLTWEDPPPGTKSFALIMDDPDAPNGTFTHWIIYNIPADSRELPEDVAKQPKLADGCFQGKNSFGDLGFGGPCPPKDSTHRYFFKLHALDIMLDLPAGASKQEIMAAIDGHVLDKAEVMGRYARQIE